MQQFFQLGKTLHCFGNIAKYTRIAFDTVQKQGDDKKKKIFAKY